MHWIHRGAEPTGLDQDRQRYTQGWVDYRSNPTINREPSDRRWILYHEDLERVFSGLCGYCEEIAKGVVDHFRPKKSFPGFTYVWDNWVLACTACNSSKGSKWPKSGYVNPCTGSASAKPETYFEYDPRSLKICPKSDLNIARKIKAKRMIEDLKLNSAYHLAQRHKFIELVSAAIPKDPNKRDAVAWNTCKNITQPSEHLSSLARAWLNSEDGTK